MISDVFNAASAAIPFVASALALYGTYRLGASTIFAVNQKEEALITMFGRHVRTETKPGLHAKWPWPINVISKKIGTDLMQVQETLDTKTKDDLFVKLPLSIQFEVSDSGKFHFDNRTPVENMKKVVSAAVRNATSDKDFQQLYSDRDEISNNVIDQIKSVVSEYGINIRRIIIDEPTAPPQVQASYNEVRASERMKEASKNKAEALKIEVVAKAQAEKEADKLRGEGKAEFRKALFDQYAAQIEKLVDKQVPREEAVRVMLDTMHQDTMREIGQGGNMVIVTPDSAPGSATRLAELQTLRPPASEQDRGRMRAAPSPV